MPTTVPPPDPARALLDAARWAEALAALEPRARAGDAAAKWLLAELIEAARFPGPAAGAAPKIQARAPIAIRLQAAALLGTLGDPRPGVATLEPVWCGPFPAGEYQIGARPNPFDNTRVSPRMVRVGTFRIARYMVTNAAYARFIEAGGYQQRQWWTAQAREQFDNQELGYEIYQREAFDDVPLHWHNSIYNQPTQPVAGVTWHEAAAYCAWLTAQGHERGWLPRSDIIRLPSEAEWEIAAFWGAEAEQTPAGQPSEGEPWHNSAEAGIGRPSPVGMFPQDRVACGALDMAGNMREWCASAYDGYPAAAGQLRGDFRFSGDLMPVMRGGAYDVAASRSGCGARVWNHPTTKWFNQGFRAIWSPPIAG